MRVVDVHARTIEERVVDCFSFFFLLRTCAHSKVFSCVCASMGARALRALNFCEHTFAHSNVFSFSLLLSLCYRANAGEVTMTDAKNKEEILLGGGDGDSNGGIFAGLSDEERNSMQIPSHMRCDACYAISHKIVNDIRDAERRHGKGKWSKSAAEKKRLRVEQYEQSFEDTCKNAEYWGEYYGVTHRKDGHNYLNGPGLTALPQTMHKGQTMSLETTRRGGFWSHRMREYCQQMVYGNEDGLDEEEMYSIVYENTPSPRNADDKAEENGGGVKRIIINKDTRAFREVMCAKICKRFPTRRPTSVEEEIKGGWEPFDEDAFTKRKAAQRKQDEAYREETRSGRGDAEL